jgi:Co/Zn/Cd efflux system component
VAAIAALAGGWLLGWSWLDPVMGIVGAVVVALWARGLIVQTSKVLLARPRHNRSTGDVQEVALQIGICPVLRCQGMRNSVCGALASQNCGYLG